MIIFGLVLSALKACVGPVFNWLNARVDAAKQVHIVDSQTLGVIATGGQVAQEKADELRAQVWEKQGSWGPVTIFMTSVLAPLVWHLWQVVGDSSRWLPSYYVVWGWLPLPTVTEHAVGSWHIAALPHPFDVVEMNIFTSLFIGASVAGATHFAVKSLRK